MAGLIGRALGAVALAAAIAAAFPRPGDAQVASPEPTPIATRAPTCSERFPAEGPAGVDLRLGCIVSELIGLYTTSANEDPPTLSAYVLLVLGGVAAGVVLVAAALRLLARRASRRLAPVLPAAWWVCPSCRSVNAVGMTRCYACGSPPGDGPLMATDASPETSQTLGRSPRS